MSNSTRASLKLPMWDEDFTLVETLKGEDKTLIPFNFKLT
jgi:hypothetical protein